MGAVDCNRLKLVDPNRAKCQAKRFDELIEPAVVVKAPAPSTEITPRPSPPSDGRLLDSYSPPSDTSNTAPFYFPEKTPVRVRLSLLGVWDGVLLSAHRVSPQKWLSVFSPPDLERQVVVDSIRTMVDFPASDVEWWRQPAVSGLQRVFLNPSGQDAVGLGLTFYF